MNIVYIATDSYVSLLGISVNSIVMNWKKGEKINEIEIKKGTKGNIQAIYEEDALLLSKKGSEKNIEHVVNLPQNVQAPIEKGQILGEIVYKQDGKEIKKVNLIADESVKKLTLLNIAEKVFLSWFRLLR